MLGEPYILAPEQIDSLTVTQARTLLDGLLSAINSPGGGDDLDDLIYPLTRMIEVSLLARPALDLETLAVKVMIALAPFQEDDSESLTVQRDCNRILSNQI